MSNKFYAPKGHKRKNSQRPFTRVAKSGASMPTYRSPQQSECALVRFVLRSAQHLDLQLDSIEEMTDEIGGEQCMCICGCKATGERVILPWHNVEYIEEIE